MAKQYNVPLPNKNSHEFKIIWGRGGYNVIKHCFPGCNIEKVHQRWKKVENSIKTDLIKGAGETIEFLRKAGFVTGLITNRSWNSLKHYKNLWRPLNFDFVQTSEYKKRRRIMAAPNPIKKHFETSCFKPNPGCFKPFFKWLKKKKINPKEIFYVGDCLVDFEAAYNESLRSGYNIEFIGVLTGPLKTQKEWNEITKTNNKFPALPSVAELPNWLRQKTKKGDNVLSPFSLTQ